MRPPLRNQLRCTTHLLPNTRKLDQSVSPLCGRTKMLQSSLGLLSDIFSPNLSNALTWNLKFLLFLIFISYHLPQPKSTQGFLIITGKLSHGEVAGTGLRCNLKVSRKLSGKVCLISTWIRALRKGRGNPERLHHCCPRSRQFCPDICLPFPAGGCLLLLTFMPTACQNPLSLKPPPRKVPGLQDKKMSVCVGRGIE